MDARNLPGPLKVAILIQALDQGAAQRIIGGLNDKERRLIHGHLNQMGPVAPVLIEKVAGEIAQKLQQARNRRLALVTRREQPEDGRQSGRVRPMGRTSRLCSPWGLTSSSS